MADSNIPNSQFDSGYYNADYFAIKDGKKFRNADGSMNAWSYANPSGEWHGCRNITQALKDIFGLYKCNSDTGLCKVLDIGCGRGQFVTYLRDLGIECWGFDFSNWAIENPYIRCQKGWIIQSDATSSPWPYGDLSFDMVMALDLMEHIYLDDINKVVSEIFRVGKKWIFLQIATVNNDGLGYILKKGQKVPIELEGSAVAGHVTVQSKDFWINKLMKDKEGNKRRGYELRNDLVLSFINKVPSDIISNWVKNTILILEKV